MNNKLLQPSRIYVFIGLIFIALISFRTISTPEIWTHLAQGKNNAPISFLESDSPVNTSHLYDKLTYVLWNIGEANLLIFLNITGLLITFVLLLQVSKKWGGSLSQAFALLIAGHLLFQTLDVGPQVVMMCFLSLFLFLLSTLKNPAVLFGVLTPLQILWSNLHGSFLYGPFIVLLTAVEAAQRRDEKSSGVSAGTLAILTMVLLISTAVNPWGFKLHGQVLAGIKSPMPVYWSSLLIEYFEISVRRPLMLFTLILGAGGLITLKKKLPVVLTIMALFGAFLVWSSPQNVPLFVVLSFPFTVISLASVGQCLHTALSSLFGKSLKLLSSASGAAFLLLAIGSMIPVVTNCAYIRAGSASNFGLGIQEQLYLDGAASILTHPLFPEKAFNFAADGGYLAFKYGRKCFIDYRPGRYDPEMLQTFANMMAGSQKAYDELYQKYRPEAMIFNTLSSVSAQGMVMLLKHRIWELIYLDGTTAILLQNKKQYAELLNHTAARKKGLAKLEKARADYARKGADCTAGHAAELIGSGTVFLTLNRPKEAKAIFTLLLQGNNAIPRAWAGLGRSQLLLKEFDNAAASLKIAARQFPRSLSVWADYARACNHAGLKEEYEAAFHRVRELAEHIQMEEKAEETE